MITIFKILLLLHDSESRMNTSTEKKTVNKFFRMKGLLRQQEISSHGVNAIEECVIIYHNTYMIIPP